MTEKESLPEPPPPLPSPLRLLLALSALCSTLHPSVPLPPPSAKWTSSHAQPWLEAILKITEIKRGQLPSDVMPEMVAHSAEAQLAEWSDAEKIRMAGILVEASLAEGKDQSSKDQQLRYTPLARSLNHRTLHMLGLPDTLLPEAEANLSATLFSALKAAQHSDSDDKVEATRAAHSQGWGGMIGRNLATGAGIIAGGVLIGVTGGLAAPAIAAVLAPLGIGGLLAGGAAPVLLGTLFGVGGGGLAGRRVRERWKGVAEFSFVEVGAGTRATKEEVDDLLEVRKRLRLKNEAEKKAADKAAIQTEAEGSMPDVKGELKDSTGTSSEKTESDKTETLVTVESVERPESPELDDEAAAKAVERNKEALEEKLLHLSLESGPRSSISYEPGSRRSSVDSPRPSLDSPSDKDLSEVKKAPSLTATIVVPGLLTVSKTEAITAWRAICAAPRASAPDPASPASAQFEDEKHVVTTSHASGLKDGRDVYLLRFETATMLQTGKDIDLWIQGKFKKKIKKEIIKRTVLSAYFAAVALPMSIYGMAGLALDNTWQKSQDRAKKAGRILGEVLEKRVQGERPVVLIGSSLGALTVLHALLYLASLSPPSGTNTPAPLYVESAFFISLPSAPSPEEWAKCRGVVARRVVNAYSDADWVLAGVVRLHEVVERAVTMQSGVRVSGLGPIGQPGVEDVNVSSILRGHMELQAKIGEIIKVIKVDA